jgi:hypothetical protein
VPCDITASKGLKGRRDGAPSRKGVYLEYLLNKLTMNYANAESAFLLAFVLHCTSILKSILK